MGGLLIRRLSQASLHLRKIEEIIILAPHDVGEFGQISDNRAIAILAIQADHGLTRLEGLGLQICADRFHRLPQFSSVIAVARTRRPRKRADPLMGMGLEYGGPRPNGFPSLTPEVARSTHLIQSTLCRWQFRGAGQGALASGLSRAIHIEDQPLRSLSVPQPSRFVLLLQRASDQVVEKHDAQRLDRSLTQRGEKARKRRAMREAFSSEEGHERSCKRMDALVERFQRAFAADRVAQQHDYEVNHIVIAEMSRPVHSRAG